jgi:hypothetical protein
VRKSIAAGSGTSFSAGTAAYSAYAPGTIDQATRSPVSTTTPAPSEPGMNGSGIGYKPVR